MIAQPETGPAPHVSLYDLSDEGLAERILELDRTLRRILPEDQHRLFVEHEDAQGILDWRRQQRADDRLIDALAKHFPGMAPAIRAIADHVDRAYDPDEHATRCGLGDDPIISFRMHDCAGRSS